MSENAEEERSAGARPREIVMWRPLQAEGATADGVDTDGEEGICLPDPKDFARELEAREAELKERIRACVHKLTPLDVMLAAMGYMRLVCFGRDVSRSAGEARDGIDELHDNNALLVPEYLQSVLVTLDTPRESGAPEEDKQPAFAELFDCCEDLIAVGRPLKMAQAIDATGWDGREGTPESFSVESKLYEDLRGRRYQALEEPYLRYLVGGQDDLIRETYGIGADDVVDGAVALMDSLIKGWQLTMGELSDSMGRLGEIDPSDAMALDGFRAEVNQSGLFDRLFGPGLFDVKVVTGWPDALIDDLTLDAYSGPDATGTAFEDLDPVEALPIRMKPFIRIDGRAYCFCYASFLDNFYRAFYGAARDRYRSRHPGSDGAFRERWNEAQADASEGAAADLLASLLPGSTVVRNSYHPLAGTGFSRKRYGESDIVVRYEDVLLSVEVKGGAYCPTDPVEDPEGHVRSLSALIGKAARQAQGTIDYVQRCAGGRCRLYDADGGTLYEFVADDIRSFFKVCVTVDDINEFAAKADKVGVIEVPEGTIAISIDDLLVYERYFESPLVFLHFLTQRRRAAGNPLVELNDELDHLGYYIYANCYTERIAGIAAEASGGAQGRFAIVPEGLREELDDWFQGLYTGQNLPKPVQESPEAFDAVVRALYEKCDSPCRRIVACSLLDLGTDARERTAASISARIAGGGAVPANSMVEIPSSGDGDVAICLFVSSPASACDWPTCREKAISAMLTRQETERAAVLCAWEDPGGIASCKAELLRGGEITESERVASAAFDSGMREMRKNAAMAIAGRKVGRNEPCPCGSGKKFKRCCGR